MSAPIVLASGSSIRAQILRQAGVEFEVVKPSVDEDSIKAAMVAVGETPRNIADALAEAKAIKGLSKRSDAVVIGSDQILVFDGKIESKCETPEQALAFLRKMQGQTHRQISAVAIAEGDKIVWRHVEEVSLTMRPLSATYLEGFIARHWTSIRHSVGCYQLEDEGVRLFARIDGDYFSALGFPALAVLNYLGDRQLIEV